MPYKSQEKKLKSCIQENTNECYFCGSTRNLHHHHIFNGSNRHYSEQYKEMCVIRLCARHHELIHKDQTLDLAIKKKAEQLMLDNLNWTQEDFIKVFHKNYI